MIDKTIFKNASRLQATIRRLSPVRSRPPQREKKRKPPKRLSPQDRKDLAEIDRQLLKEIDVSTLREILIRELYCPHGTTKPDKIVTPRLVRIASESLSQAICFTRLLLRATLFYQRPADCHEREEIPDHFVEMLFIYRTMRMGNLVSLEPIPDPFRIVELLVAAAKRGNLESRNILSLLIKEMMQFGFNPIPVADEDYADCHFQALQSAQPCHDNQGMGAAYPFACPENVFDTMKEITGEALAEAKENYRRLKDLERKVSAIPVSAFESFLTRVWEMISKAAESEHRLVLSGGRDKVVISIDALRYTGLDSIAFFREEPDGGWCPFPKIHVHFFWDHGGEHHITRTTISEQGEIVGYHNDSWPVYLIKILWCVVYDAYAEIVLPNGTSKESNPSLTVPCKARPRRNRRQRHRTAGQTSVVHPYFRRLAEGWEASAQQIERSIKVVGHAPPTGHTFVDEFERLAPDQPAQTQRDAWKANADHDPVLLYDDGTVEGILADIRSFIPTEP